ncbi:ATPase E1-E2 type family protein / haloacid dehalogenase-like hydrolase family protein [Prunus dulcis]|uniref:ATPase E1-E2 type family protein / haloacid dehalogenase-like hydrolase family protein n=1 Tax=Prunus dulcis TaxID=3755 RepID=A0A5H2XR12_PRUDU|nr:ATPase E1-E2 type family protein / haloacid dehalogenase-like hydrolase family protein [Prunus dulcis]
MHVSLDEGVKDSNISIRQNSNLPETFFVLVWEALQDLTLIILMVCAVVSIGVGIATEGWPKGMYDGVGILISIVLVVMVTVISDYGQSLQFKDLDREKKRFCSDIVRLSIGDQVPGWVRYNASDNSWYENRMGKIDGNSSERGEDETPLQLKLNGVATIIGKIGLTFVVLTFLVLAVRFLVEKILNNEITDWSSTDAVILLNYFAIALTIIVVAVPEGLPLAVTLSLAFAMKKLMDDRALVRHLSACETMGSTSCICTDKTGTLTTNHMVVNKIWICEKPLDVKGNESKEILSSEISGASSILLQVIFQNTSSEVIKEDGRTSILGTPTESALLEFGLLLGGDFDAVRGEVNILKVEPFNSVRKKMSVLVAHPHGGKRAFCKGASEIVKNITDVINSFASEALRTICLAFKNIDDSSIENDIPDDGYCCEIYCKRTIRTNIFIERIFCSNAKKGSN